MSEELPHTDGRPATTSASIEVLDTQRTTACIVGGGPAGAVLALLLARQDIPVVLLEEHLDFDRDFRGDTIHPAIMQIMDELGLADDLLRLPHTELHSATVQTVDGPFTLLDFRYLKTRYPYITFMPQKHFLEFITEQARRYPAFQLVMGARVEHLIEEDGSVRGVRYRSDAGWHEVTATLTVGADGRFSRTRRLAGFTPIKTSPPIDVLWFRLPRRATDPTDAFGRPGAGHLFIQMERGDQWQIADVIAKGTYQQLRAAGIAALRQTIAEQLPDLADRVDVLQEWKQVSLLSIESDRLPRWYRSGLLLIGDAAHTMSPVAGVGINYAIQDAVVASNVLAGPLKAGHIQIHHLAAVQREREWPLRVMQALQAIIQRQVVAGILAKREPLRIPRLVRIVLTLPVVRTLPGRLIGFGIRPSHVRPGPGA